MSKSVPDSVMDKILDEIASATLQSVVSDSDTPTDLSNELADVEMSSDDFSKAEGDEGSGSRKITMASKSGVDVDASGEPKHVVLSLDGDIKLVTTCSGPDLTSGSTVDFPSWEYEIGVPE